jgi:hypothetical protein
MKKLFVEPRLFERFNLERATPFRLDVHRIPQLYRLSMLLKNKPAGDVQ